MKIFLAFVFCLLASCGGTQRYAQDGDCSDRCSKYYSRSVEGVWEGDDPYLGVRRCACLSGQTETHLLFPL